MHWLDWFKEVNNSLSVLAWPAVTLIIAYRFKDVISDLLARVTRVEGRFGETQLKLEVEKIVTSGVSKAAELESQGKKDEAEKISADTAEIVSGLYGLSVQDLEYLEHLEGGGAPKRRWGPVHLVRSGLVELDGGKLTAKGSFLVKRYKQLTR